ncbi:hypothetical protein SAMN05661086_01940 [Anaeromicropila populeti]|uniref:Peptidase family M50 n=1 Tax=Anaeromicropila populeti TaxID=37658 RepID=A0A1I6JS74_9FIRM|nr:hypothetical protein SAMN05661086_01940 [Anaeromicropila populeti]
MHILKIFFLLYIMNIVSIIIHECSHLLTSLLFFGGYEEISIGNLFYFHFTKKIKVSPIIFSGYVSVGQEKIIEFSYVKICVFFLIGPFASFVLGYLFYFQVSTLLFRLIGIYNMLSAIIFLLPLPNTDMYNMIRVVSYKVKTEK